MNNKWDSQHRSLLQLLSLFEERIGNRCWRGHKVQPAVMWYLQDGIWWRWYSCFMVAVVWLCMGCSGHSCFLYIELLLSHTLASLLPIFFYLFCFLGMLDFLMEIWWWGLGTQDLRRGPRFLSRVEEGMKFKIWMMLSMNECYWDCVLKHFNLLK